MIQIRNIIPVPDMTYNVFGGTLSLTQSISQVHASCCSIYNSAIISPCLRELFHDVIHKIVVFLACHVNELLLFASKSVVENILSRGTSTISSQ